MFIRLFALVPPGSISISDINSLMFKCVERCYKASIGIPRLVEFLLDQGGEIDSCDKDGRSLLIRAVEYSDINLDLCKLLISRGICIDTCDRKGNYALSIAVLRALGEYAYNRYSRELEADEIIISLLKFTASAQSQKDRAKILKKAYEVAAGIAERKQVFELAVTPQKLLYWASLGEETNVVA
jgi:hypothetical protein